METTANKNKAPDGKPITDWKRRGIRLGWTIRMANGKFAVVTWISNGQMMAKVLDNQ